MSSSVFWLSRQLKKCIFRPLNENCIEIDIDNVKKIVYCPTTEEYEITSAVVVKAKEQNASIITYPTSWCKATSNAISSGRQLDIEVIPFGEFLKKYES